MDKLEKVAEQIHEGWREYQTQLGRVFGPERNDRTHPHMIPWSQLDNESQNQDRFIAAIVLDEWSRGRLTCDQLPRAIHDTWSRWVRLQGRTHPHANPFEIVHPTGSDEHQLQAQRLEPLLRSTTAVEPRNKWTAIF